MLAEVKRLIYPKFFPCGMGVILVDGITVPVESHKGKDIIIGSDHRGFAYKSAIKEALRQQGYSISDVGTFSTERCDYPAISDAIGKRVSEDPFYSVGIGICGSGIGILIPASKHRGVYVARCLTPQEAETSRRHNNTNVLGIGADYVDLETALAIVDTWLKTPFYADQATEQPYLQRFMQTVRLERARRQF
jgi:ribose 5-phosphate isomerase B